MVIAGLQKTTLVDYPGKVAATVFTRGCSFACPFCHNPELVISTRFNPRVPPEDFWSFLSGRQGKLEGVCITGGEPMLHPDIIDFMKKIKDMGYLVKLDTNGSFPDRLEQAIKERAMDYIATDIKSPISRYREITRSLIPDLEERVTRSIGLIMSSSIPYEFRTTFFKPLLSVDDVPKMGEMIRGAEQYFIQNFVHSKHNDEELEMSPFGDEEIERTRVIMSQFVKKVGAR